MKCLVGLGNPGRNYAAHRHNFGFMVVDYILKHTSLDFHNRRMEHGQIWRSSEFMLAKPETFMNLSGQAVSELLRYTPVEMDQLLIAYDDVSLDFGQLRIRKQGSAGSHNGMKSVI
ncbi:MAG: aminoacyl-tRNA hydrolase, partial [Candidatus Delongbacteria bacterium]|nr:aminoacyl-tRNA hydrolase [Candidatus Delongbacteria bacterium]